MEKMPISLALVAMTYLAGCAGAGIDGTAPRLYNNAKQMVKEAKIGVAKISSQSFKAKLASEEVFSLIDVSEPDDYEEEEENIPGSITLPRGLLEFNIASKSFWDEESLDVPKKEDPIIVYSKKEARGALAAETLVKLGYENVKYLAGGWVVWKHGPGALKEEEEPKEESGCGG